MSSALTTILDESVNSPSGMKMLLPDNRSDENEWATTALGEKDINLSHKVSFFGTVVHHIY